MPVDEIVIDGKKGCIEDGLLFVRNSRLAQCRKKGQACVACDKTMLPHALPVSAVARIIASPPVYVKTAASFPYKKGRHYTYRKNPNKNAAILSM